jgi:DNA-binding MarR family transcriptional regulator
MSSDPDDADLSLAATFAGWAMTDAIQRRLAEQGFDDVRSADGVVFQHLLAAPTAIGALAERLGVTQQATSKAVADLERRGYVERTPDPSDARARVVRLTRRGDVVIEAARAAREELARELAERHGAARVDDARRLLLEVVDGLGGTPDIRRRRVRPPA